MVSHNFCSYVITNATIVLAIPSLCQVLRTVDSNMHLEIESYIIYHITLESSIIVDMTFTQ